MVGEDTNSLNTTLGDYLTGPENLQIHAQLYGVPRTQITAEASTFWRGALLSRTSAQNWLFCRYLRALSQA